MLVKKPVSRKPHWCKNVTVYSEIDGRPLIGEVRNFELVDQHGHTIGKFSGDNLPKFDEKPMPTYMKILILTCTPISLYFLTKLAFILWAIIH